MGSPSLLSNVGSDLWAWWISQLRDLVPAQIRSLITGAGQDVVVEFGKGVVHVTRGTFSQAFLLGNDPATSIRKALNAITAFRLFAPRIRLRLSHGLCLIRRVAIPQAARHRLAEIVRLDLASAVPMAPEDYLAAHYEDAAGAVAVIVKRRFADESLALLAKAGYPAAALDIWDAGGRKPLPVNLLPAPRERRTRRIAQMLLIASLAIFAFSLWLSWSQRGEAFAKLDSAIAEARKDADRVMANAATVNALTEALVAIRKRKVVQPSALIYWEEIARLLPDTGWLSNLTISGGRIVMTGTSSSSPELIGTLERSPLFADVGFSSPVTFERRPLYHRACARAGEAMKTLPRLHRTLISRLLALAIPLAGLMATWTIVIEPIAVAFAERDNEIETRRALLARYIAVTRQEKLLRDSLSEANAEIERGELLPDQPPAMLAADLQAKIGALAQAHNVQIHSTQNLPVRTSGPLREAGIGFAAQGTQSDLRDLLIDIDKMQPFLFADRLVITSFDAGALDAATPPLVAVEIDLYGVIRP